MSPNTTPSAPRSKAGPARWCATAGVETAAGEVLSVVLLAIAGLLRSGRVLPGHCCLEKRITFHSTIGPDNQPVRSPSTKTHRSTPCQALADQPEGSGRGYLAR